MAKSESIAGGTGSDPIRCSACGKEIEIAAYFTDSGAAFHELCTGACEEPIVDSIGVFDYETNQIARIFICKAAENVDTGAIVEESPKSDRGK